MGSIDARCLVASLFPERIGFGVSCVVAPVSFPILLITDHVPLCAYGLLHLPVYQLMDSAFVDHFGLLWMTLL